MTSDEAALAVIEGLESLRIPYMLVGSFSSNFYGAAEASRDVNLVVPAGSQLVDQLAAHLVPQFQVNAWCDRLGCRAALDEIRQSIPPM